eukprot:403337757
MNPQQQQYQNPRINSDNYSEGASYAPLQQQDQYNHSQPQPLNTYPVQYNQGYVQQQNDQFQGYFSHNNHKLQNWHVLRIFCMILSIPTLSMCFTTLFAWQQTVMVFLIIHTLYTIFYHCIDHASRIYQLKQIVWIIASSLIALGGSFAYFIVFLIDYRPSRYYYDYDVPGMVIASCCMVICNEILFITCVALENKKYKNYFTTLIYQPVGQGVQYVPIRIQPFVGKQPDAYQIVPVQPQVPLQVNALPRMNVQPQHKSNLNSRYSCSSNLNSNK